MLTAGKKGRLVTPFAGVWIEIEKFKAMSLDERMVTPFAGVWIEIDMQIMRSRSTLGHSLRGSVD